VNEQTQHESSAEIDPGFRALELVLKVRESVTRRIFALFLFLAGGVGGVLSQWDHLQQAKWITVIAFRFLAVAVVVFGASYGQGIRADIAWSNAVLQRGDVRARPPLISTAWALIPLVAGVAVGTWLTWLSMWIP
jgi:hypothetical protein